MDQNVGYLGISLLMFQIYCILKWDRTWDILALAFSYLRSTAL